MPLAGADWGDARTVHGLLLLQGEGCKGAVGRGVAVSVAVAEGLGVAVGVAVAVACSKPGSMISVPITRFLASACVISFTSSR